MKVFIAWVPCAQSYFLKYVEMVWSNLFSRLKIHFRESTFSPLFQKQVHLILKKSIYSMAVIRGTFSQGQKRKGLEYDPAAVEKWLDKKDSPIWAATKRLWRFVLHSSPQNWSLQQPDSESLFSGPGQQELAEVVSTAVSGGYPYVTVGGDYSLAIGIISGHAHHSSDLHVVWDDARANISSGLNIFSENFHGQPVLLLLREL